MCAIGINGVIGVKILNNALTIEEILTKILHFENNYSEQCSGF